MLRNSPRYARRASRRLQAHDCTYARDAFAMWAMGSKRANAVCQLWTPAAAQRGLTSRSKNLAIARLAAVCASTTSGLLFIRLISESGVRPGLSLTSAWNEYKAPLSTRNCCALHLNKKLWNKRAAFGLGAFLKTPPLARQAAGAIKGIPMGHWPID
jgi:hypothetical protein